VREDIFFFYDDLYYSRNRDYNFPKALSKCDIQEILSGYINIYCERDNKEIWFNKLKAFGETLGYSPSVKNFKKNPSAYKGHIGDVAMVLRIALTKKTATPDLYEMITVLGTERLMERLIWNSLIIVASTLVVTGMIFTLV
jgi:glutamyl-tRNA synthetase